MSIILSQVVLSTSSSNTLIVNVERLTAWDKNILDLIVFIQIFI